MMSSTMPEHIFAGRIYDYVEAPSFAPSWYEDEPLVGLTEYIRADVAQEQIDAAQAMILERDARIAELESSLSALRYDRNLYYEMAQQQLKGIHNLQTHIIERDAIIAGQAERLVERDAKRPGRHNLLALREATDDACAAAWEDCEDCRYEAVNWADLKCIGAEWYVDDDGVPGHRVWVDEADPAAYRLRDFVAGYLERAGFAGVHVVLEW